MTKSLQTCTQTELQSLMHVLVYSWLEYKTTVKSSINRHFLLSTTSQANPLWWRTVKHSKPMPFFILLLLISMHITNLHKNKTKKLHTFTVRLFKTHTISKATANGFLLDTPPPPVLFVHHPPCMDKGIKFIKKITQKLNEVTIAT